MIVTLTMNPSVDRTADVAGPLERGGVNRLSDITDVAGGKGINVTRVLRGSGAASTAWMRSACCRTSATAARSSSRRCSCTA